MSLLSILAESRSLRALSTRTHIQTHTETHIEMHTHVTMGILISLIIDGNNFKGYAYQDITVCVLKVDNVYCQSDPQIVRESRVLPLGEDSGLSRERTC